LAVTETDEEGVGGNNINSRCCRGSNSLPLSVTTNNYPSKTCETRKDQKENLCTYVIEKLYEDYSSHTKYLVLYT
jgi:hypothetical protein